MTPSRYRVGIDVGGTNTDAVILRDNHGAAKDHGIVAWEKSSTTQDVTEGISNVLRAVLQNSNIAKEEIAYVSIGTTHFVNAVVEADPSRLSRIAVIRLAGPYTRRCLPFTDFPPRLRKIIEGHTAIIGGGLQIDGKEITPVNINQVLEQCEIISGKGIKHIVVVGVFSPLAASGTQEEYVKQLIEDRLGKRNVEVVCSKDVGHVGLLERENAAILNTAILTFARRTIRSYREVLKTLELKCPLYLTQLDGTLVSSRVAVSVPIRTFSNGPTNSMRGASYLAQLDKSMKDKSLMVIDVGGTTTDVGVLLPSGFPRKAAAFTEVGGVRMSFSMPDVYSVGLGGGSRVRFNEQDKVTVGPDSVGHNIMSSAKIFGGSELTATDLAVAAGLESAAGIGDKAFIEKNVSEEELQRGLGAIRQTLESAIDRMKTDPGDVTLLLVGGGSIIVPPVLQGVKEILRPPFFNVANAVGAAIARVSGTVDRIEIPGNRSFDDILDGCKEEAIQKAIDSGASRETTSVAEVAIVELPYVANHASRMIVRAVGDLDLNTFKHAGTEVEEEEVAQEGISVGTTTDESVDDRQKIFLNQTQEAPVDISTYKPNISEDGVWFLNENDVEWIAEGCAILGCGGGGATYSAFLMARQAVRAGHKIRVVDSEFVSRAGPDAWIMPCGFMGSPSVSSERISSGQEIPTACRHLKKYLGMEKVVALISDEIGGKNGLEPMLLATESDFDLPIVDADLMGRAYPRLNQIMPCIYKENGLYPVVAADGMGNCMIVPSAESNPIVEDILRAACTALGSCVALSISPLQARDLSQYTIAGSTSQAWRIGRSIALCRSSRNLSRISEAITELQDGRCLFVGKIVDVLREVRGGFTHGRITIAPLLLDEMEGPAKQYSDFQQFSPSDRLVVPFQNENLYADLVKEDGSKKTICCVPDLITVLDAQNGSAIGTQDYRYGLRVVVIGLACDPRWASPEGLKIGGPEAFGLEVDYKPIGVYREPMSVIKEFRPSSPSAV